MKKILINIMLIILSTSLYAQGEAETLELKLKTKFEYEKFEEVFNKEMELYYTSVKDIPNINDNYVKFSFTIADKGYVGVYTSNSYELLAFYEYDSTKDKWRELSKPEDCIILIINSFVVGSKGYVVTSNSILEYNPAIDNWEIIKFKPLKNENTLRDAFTYNDKIYFVATNNGRAKKGEKIEIDYFNNDIYEYNKDKNKLKKIGNIPYDTKFFIDYKGKKYAVCRTEKKDLDYNFIELNLDNFSYKKGQIKGTTDVGEIKTIFSIDNNLYFVGEPYMATLSITSWFEGDKDIRNISREYKFYHYGNNSRRWEEVQDKKLNTGIINTNFVINGIAYIGYGDYLEVSDNTKSMNYKFYKFNPNK